MRVKMLWTNSRTSRSRSDSHGHPAVIMVNLKRYMMARMTPSSKPDPAQKACARTDIRSDLISSRVRLQPGKSRSDDTLRNGIALDKAIKLCLYQGTEGTSVPVGNRLRTAVTFGWFKHMARLRDDGVAVNRENPTNWSILLPCLHIVSGSTQTLCCMMLFGRHV